MISLRSVLCVGVVIALGGLSSCSSLIYDWGSYEASLYRQYSGGEIDTSKDLGRLQAECDRSLEKNKLIPPGKLAYVGSLAFKEGDSAEARKRFVMEREFYPESATFMNFLLKRMPER